MFSMYEHNEEKEWQKLRESERKLGQEIKREQLLENLMKNTNMTCEEAKEALGIVKE